MIFVSTYSLFVVCFHCRESQPRLAKCLNALITENILRYACNVKGKHTPLQVVPTQFRLFYFVSPSRIGVDFSFRFYLDVHCCIFITANMSM